jgi:hypothetical protein
MHAVGGGQSVGRTQGPPPAPAWQVPLTQVCPGGQMGQLSVPPQPLEMAPQDPAGHWVMGAHWH